MARRVTEEEKTYIINMLTLKNKDGNYTYGQRELEREINVSRPYLRKMAKIAGRHFDRNGWEIRPDITICCNCGQLFRRSKSKLDGKKHVFCDVLCKEAYYIGERHNNWKGGVTLKSWSTWVTNQSQWKNLREEMLLKCGNMCEITGEKTSEPQIHHLKFKGWKEHPELVFEPSNIIVLSKWSHHRLHSLLSQKKSYDESVEIIKKEYKEKQNGK